MKISSGKVAYGMAWFAWISGAVVFYGSSFLLYAFLLRKDALARLSPLSAISVMVLVVLAGALIFGEHISMRRGAGILVGMIAIFLLAK
jgi:drug/metabolite transporter (DMT)-like permease